MLKSNFVIYLIFIYFCHLNTENVIETIPRGKHGQVMDSVLADSLAT